MNIDRGKATILALLVAVLAVVVYRGSGGPQPSPANPSTRGAAAPSNDSRGAAKNAENTAQGAPDVHLETLTGDRPRPVGSDRNLFRFKPKAAPPPPRVTAPPVIAPTAPVVPSG